MRKFFQHISTEALLIVAVAVVTPMLIGSCGNDGSLGGSFKPAAGDNDTPPWPQMPIAVGDTFHWSFRKVYDPEIVNSGTANEKSTAGALCLKVTEIEDNYPEDAESKILADVRLSNNNGSQDVFFQDQNNEFASASQVDSFHNLLWLKSLMPPTRGHGFATKGSATFNTQQSVVPAFDFKNLLFFDVRPADNAEQGGWGGWAGYTTDFFGHLASTFGANYPSSDDLSFSPPKNGVGCDAGVDQMTCPVNNCLWDFANSECVALFSLEIKWRETASGGPAELAGKSILHRLRVDYNGDGVMRTMSELVRLDDSGGIPVDQISSSMIQGCGGEGTACAQSEIGLEYAPWNDTGTGCSF